MSDAESLAPLLAVLSDLMARLQIRRIPSLVLGGIAVSLLSRPRVTRDVDVVVILDERYGSEFIGEGVQFGFVPRRPDVLTFAQRTRVLLVHHGPSRIDVDIVFGALPFEKEAMTRAVWVDLGNVQVPLPTPEDLIIMKAVAHRPRGLADIEPLLDTHLKLDLRRVRRWVGEFSTALEIPEILNDLEAILIQRPKRRRRGKD